MRGRNQLLLNGPLYQFNTAFLWKSPIKGIILNVEASHGTTFCFRNVLLIPDKGERNFCFLTLAEVVGHSMSHPEVALISRILYKYGLVPTKISVLCATRHEMQAMRAAGRVWGWGEHRLSSCDWEWKGTPCASFYTNVPALPWSCPSAGEVKGHWHHLSLNHWFILGTLAHSGCAGCGRNTDTLISTWSQEPCPVRVWWWSVNQDFMAEWTISCSQEKRSLMDKPEGIYTPSSPFRFSSD